MMSNFQKESHDEYLQEYLRRECNCNPRSKEDVIYELTDTITGKGITGTRYIGKTHQFLIKEQVIISRCLEPCQGQEEEQKVQERWRILIHFSTYCSDCMTSIEPEPSSKGF
jgi:hypothetical protein